MGKIRPRVDETLVFSDEKSSYLDPAHHYGNLVFMHPPAFKISAIIACAAISGSITHAATLLSTDFTNTSIAGTTMNGVSWTENGLSAPTSLSASSNLFTAGAAAAANGYMSVGVNINGSTELLPAWSTTWTITVGASDIQLDTINLFSVEHNSGGSLGAGNGTSRINLSIVDNNTSGTVANQTLTKSNGNATPEELIYNFGGSPLAMTGGNTYDVTFTLWENSSSGHFEALDSVSFEGSTAIPEPSSMILLGLFSLCLLRRRR